ncbi:MAG: DsrE family protein [Anaerolineae bacterium]|nr:DsrE family protein [Anaerolineae bacterium]
MSYNHIQKSTVILITHDGMGKADTDLQHKLVSKYLEMLVENDLLPGAICFYTEGVKLVCEGSPVLEQLRKLDAKNVPLIVCQTCLNHFGLTDKVQVGIVGGMGDIIEAQWRADKVITL